MQALNGHGFFVPFFFRLGFLCLSGRVGDSDAGGACVDRSMAYLLLGQNGTLKYVS